MGLKGPDNKGMVTNEPILNPLVSKKNLNGNTLVKVLGKRGPSHRSPVKVCLKIDFLTVFCKLAVRVHKSLGIWPYKSPHTIDLSQFFRYCSFIHIYGIKTENSFPASSILQVKNHKTPPINVTTPAPHDLWLYFWSPLIEKFASIYSRVE